MESYRFIPTKYIRQHRITGVITSYDNFGPAVDDTQTSFSSKTPEEVLMAACQYVRETGINTIEAVWVMTIRHGTVVTLDWLWSGDQGRIWNAMFYNWAVNARNLVFIQWAYNKSLPYNIELHNVALEIGTTEICKFIQENFPEYEISQGELTHHRNVKRAH